ncbi:MAG TPA: hypothetical protein VLE23_11960 [Geminicoccaceae bacterium]|nr:hypothetical protein [Geminicoccaceae bacterium]
MTAMASARRTVVLPVPPASPDAAARQSWSARPKHGSEPRSGPLGARVEAAPKAALAEGDHVGRRGLSVAQTARASPIAFRPLQRRPEVAPAAPPPPAEPLAGVTPRRVEPRARFVKTVAELERSQAAATGREGPGARIVPRPALARPEQGAAAGSPWTRLWPRRKGSAAG